MDTDLCALGTALAFKNLSLSLSSPDTTTLVLLSEQARVEQSSNPLFLQPPLGSSDLVGSSEGTDDVVIFVALGVNLAAAAGLDATGDGANGKGPSETVEAFPEDSMLSVRWSADPGGTAVRTGLRLAIFVMSFSGDTTSGAGAAATDAGASPEPRSSRSPPDSHASSAIASMRRPRWVVPVRR